MRVAIAGISHETNTYCTATTRREDFHELRGNRMLATADQESDVGGAVAACHDLGVEPVPLLFVSAQPSGVIERDTYDGFKEEILEGLAASAPLDGVVLCLHGAGVVDGLEDLEGDLAAAVRSVVGPDVPVVATFDLHGNVTQAMADVLNGVFACHHYPHVDLHERAREAVELLVSIRRDGTRPVSVVTTLPMLMPTTTTFIDPGRTWLERMLSAEQEPGVIDVSWFHGFPYTDVTHVGTAIVVTTDGNRDQARRISRELANALWAARAQFEPASLSAERAVADARALPWRPGDGPIILQETSDNCGGGAPGDGTHLLRAMLDADLEKACFGFIVDPETAAAAHAAGVGATIDVRVGGKTDDLHGEPLPLRVYVKSLHDGRITLQAMFRGAPLNLGPMARLVPEGAGVEIIVASRRSQTFDPEPFLALGVDVRRCRYVALKSSNHFRAGFQDIASAIVTADPPGLTTHHIEVFPRQRATRPLWPVDQRATFEAAV
ncbi:MAG: M81 family metallopeptidase [Pseudomonadales bacterium]